MAEEELDDSVVEEEMLIEDEEAGLDVIEEEDAVENALEGVFEDAPEGVVAGESTEAGLAEAVGGTSGNEIIVDSFNKLRLDEDTQSSMQDAWVKFVGATGSREAAGLALYSAIFESGLSLQSLFTSPKAVQASKLFEAFNTFINTLSDPASLQVKVETLCFAHMGVEVTVPRVSTLRDAIQDLFQVELGDKLPRQAMKGFTALLNYIGGAIIFIKAHYSERLKILGDSWRLANDKAANDNKFATFGSKEMVHEHGAEGKPQDEAGKPVEDHFKKGNQAARNVPTTYSEMFLFNAAVMGFGSALWMNEVLAQFDNIVKNVSNPNRFGEECEVLSLRIAKVSSRSQVNLADYKSCMLASLRSLLPKEWSTAHEVAWSWLWENVERKLLAIMGKPPLWEKTLGRWISLLDETQAFEFRAAMYARFFALCPVGQDFFKQSTTYLHLMAIKIMSMTIDMYREPVRMTDDISATGLRHVGYGIPTEHFGPYVTSWVEVMQAVTQDEVLIDSLRWSMGLIAKSLVRTIQEGSTIVMKAINLNTKKSMLNAVSCAPRGSRANWCLMVQVGTQNISPLAWAVQSGALESASSILSDLLTMRADREQYYFGADELFTRHPDIVKRLCDDAPTLLPELLDGLIWRSRSTYNGMRRVNYYVKHLLVGPDGRFHQTLEWVAKLKDPKIVCHPVLVLLADTTWSRIASAAFLFKQSWFLLTLLVFIFGQALLEKTPLFEPQVERYAVFVCRCFIYVFTMGQAFLMQVGMIIKSYRKKNVIMVFKKIPVPKYLENWQDSARLVLVIIFIIMLASEPVLCCIGTPEAEKNTFTQDCPEAESTRKFPYTTACMMAIYIYFVLLIDLAVFSTRFSAYVLACTRMLAEVGLFLLAVCICLVMFACGFSCLHQSNEDFHGIHVGALTLWELLIGGYTDEKTEKLHEETMIIFGCYVFLVVVAVFLMNMLVAQLSCSYGSTYADMVGFARLRRINLIVETMVTVSDRRWNAFLAAMAFEKKLEFNEGDIGLAGGIATSEAASAHPTTVDMIQRFGGSTSPEFHWPATSSGTSEEETDKVERLEKLISKVAVVIAGGGSASKTGGGAQSSVGGSNMENVAGGSGSDVETEAEVEEE